MKVFFIYNPNSGRHSFKRKLKYIKKHLAPLYECFDVSMSISPDHFKKEIHKASSNYDLIIVGGGDGSVNMAINVIAKLDKRPVLSFIPMGTLNDAIRNLGYPRSYKKCINLIKKSIIKDIDIIKVNNKYVSYAACTGAYSDLSYKVKNKEKKYFGRLSYYVHAIPRLFKSKIVEGYIVTKERNIPFRANFIMVLNGKRIGGFNINKSSNIEDGKVEIIYTRPGLFNSLMKYFFFKKQIHILPIEEFQIELKNPSNWGFDGELGSKGNIKGIVLKKHLTILSE